MILFSTNNYTTTSVKDLAAIDDNIDIYVPIEFDTEYNESRYPFDTKTSRQRGTICL